jgi:hypothetical protein
MDTLAARLPVPQPGMLIRLAGRDERQSHRPELTAGSFPRLIRLSAGGALRLARFFGTACPHRLRCSCRRGGQRQESAHRPAVAQP